jgi:hypothetical protein
MVEHLTAVTEPHYPYPSRPLEGGRDSAGSRPQDLTLM